METLLERAVERVVLLDGAMGTMLFAKGLNQGEAPDSWNLKQPDAVASVHRDYLEAGAEAVLTNTFGGTSIRLADNGLEGKTAEINRKAVEIARSVCTRGEYVVGDIGPTGQMLEPYGDLPESYLRTSLREQISTLLEVGVDALLFETQMDLREAAVGVEIARRLTRLPILASFTFNQTKRGFFTLMGNSVKDAITAVQEAGADGVGTNCSLDSRQMKGLVTEIASVAAKPILVKANAGTPELVEGELRYAQSIEDYVSDVPAYLDRGTRLIGGCCGTTPTFIAALERMLKQRIAAEG